MPHRSQNPREVRQQVQLFLEETVTDLLQREEAAAAGCPLGEVRVTREGLLLPGVHGDARIQAPGRPPVLLEVKQGRSAEYVQNSIRRKYSSPGSVGNAQKIVLVTGTEDLDARARKEATVSPASGVEIELLERESLVERIETTYGVRLSGLSAQHIAAARDELDAAKWAEVWDGEFAGHPLQTALLWHLGHRQLRELRTARGIESPEGILMPRLYKNVVVLLADMSSFSSYVRDTRDHAVVRNALASFYSNARSAALSHDGLLYMFMGDEAIVLFGIPDSAEDATQKAVECAYSLIDIGNSVSTEWQRRIDHVQADSGVHIGMAIGDLDLIPERPLNPGRMAAIGDAINLGARLRSRAQSNEVLTSNTLYQALPLDLKGHFREADPVDGRNLGHIKAWSLDLSDRAARPGNADDPRTITGSYEAFGG